MNMTPQEKAKQLVDYFMDLSEEQEYDTPRYMPKAMAKQCALKTVDEMIEIRNEIVNTLKLGALDVEVIAFLEEVKEEIEKL